MAAGNVLIVGGGLSGLSTAYALAKRGIRSTIVEKAGRLGGVIKTDQISGCQLDAGPESFLATKPQIATLANELDGLSAKIIGSNDKARRIFVVRRGKLVPMPQGMAMMVPGEWQPALRSRLFSTSTKVRLVRETFMSPRYRSDDFSVGELVKDHFGDEMFEYVTDPLLSGVFGGNATDLSARSVLPRFVGYEERYGSLIKGVREAARDKDKNGSTGSLFQSFEGGMQTLTDALSKAITKDVPVLTGEAASVEKVENGWRVRIGSESLSCAELVLACPAHTSAMLLQKAAPEAAAQLSAIPYSSSILTMMVFDKATLGHALNGFGFLVPRRERRTIAAATWVNTKFPSRIREGLAALRAFIGGEQATLLLNAEASKDTVAELVLQDFKRLMNIQATPLITTVYFWPNSMPQYVVGHEDRIRLLRQNIEQIPGIYLAGNIFDGVGMPDCVRRAEDVAKQIADGRV